MEELALSEKNKIVDLLKELGVPEKKITFIMPLIENTAWMKVKLDEAREVVRDSSVVISYDNGGGQKGIRENPIFKGYESLFKTYISGMDKILATIPTMEAKEAAVDVIKPQTMLEIVRNKKKNIV